MDTYNHKGKLVAKLENAFSIQFAGTTSSLPERMVHLGIPAHEMTESVTLAISALMEKADDLQLSLDQTRAQLKEIESLVDVDCVAPIPNRRAFMRRLNWVIAMHERYNHPSSVLFFDLNRFKDINDTYGHAAGDLAIRHVADLLADMTRESDFLARIGGDEFAIILYYATHEDAVRRGEHIAEMLRRTPLDFNNRPLTIETAVGIHTIRSGETAEIALQQADQSMYEHKRQLKAAITELNA
ncbi:MAG: GGDEF domain-containing protein [Rickettsiales bacterium]|nr:GGDEF domain-containing protein [Rickettsiales bacterium]